MSDQAPIAHYPHGTPTHERCGDCIVEELRAYVTQPGGYLETLMSTAAAHIEALEAERTRLRKELAPLTPTGVQALETAERERDEWKELRLKDVWFQSALFQLLLENDIQPSSGELLDAWKKWETSEQEARLQNDREWRAKLDHVKAELTAARDVIEAARHAAISPEFVSALAHYDALRTTEDKR